MTIKLITFDLDDTLWDVKPPLIRAEKKQNNWLRVHRPKTESILDDKALLTFKKDVWKLYPELRNNVSEMRLKVLCELQRDAGYSDELALAGAKAAFNIFIKERCAVKLYPDVLGTISLLHTDFILGALTNGNADIFLTPVAKYFSFAYRAEDVGASKPSPELFEAARAYTDLTFKEIIHIGDDPAGDIMGAKGVGAKAIWLNRGHQPWAGEIDPDEEIHSLSELPKVLSNFSESLKYSL